VPAIVVLAVAFLYPVALILARAFTDHTTPGGTFSNLQWFFEDPVQVRILVRTFTTSAIVTTVCLLVSYPYAYLATLVSPRWRMVMLGIAIVSCWESIVVRNYAWRILLRDNGVVNDILAFLGFARVDLLGTTTAVVIGMAHVMAPFMILPLYAGMRSIDRRLLTAATSLGATPARAFSSVYLPLSLPGIAAGTVLVAVLSLGFFITPALLGSLGNALLSQSIVSEIQKTSDWGHAGAQSLVLVAVTMALLALGGVLARRRLAKTAAGVGGPVMVERRRRVGLTGLAQRAFAVLVALWLVVPIATVIPISLAGEASFLFPPKSYGTRWYENLLTDPAWRDALLTSLRIAAYVVGASVILGTACALALDRSRLRAKLAIRGLVLAPLVVPIVALGVGIYATFLPWHLIGTDLGFVLGHTVLALPYVVVSVSTSLAGFDRNLEQAAASLGASPVTAFFTVTLPHLIPGVMAGAVFAFIVSFDELVIALFLITPFKTTLPVEMYQSLERIDPTIAAASTLLLALTSAGILLMLVFNKSVRGQTD
jgi:putative spermidine/putrescine transport system permease protein